MLYDYECEECKNVLKDVYQSIKDEALVKCPSCGKESLRRIIYGGIASFMKDAKTIGQLADNNWSKLGHYKRSEIETKHKEKKEKETSPFSSFGEASKKDIMKMNEAQKQKYILKGEK
jgi:putative FmdB family regulatory protein